MMANVLETVTPHPSQGREVEDAEIAEFLEGEEDSAAAKPSGQRVCYKHERAIPIQETVEALDLREEGEEESATPKGHWQRCRRVNRRLLVLSRRDRDPPVLPGAAPAPLAGAAATHLLLLSSALLRGTPAAPGCGAVVRTGVPSAIREPLGITSIFPR